MRLGNYTPGFIVSYDATTRLARVQIPGVTDGCEVYPQAQFCYPIGDSSEITDIRVLPGDRVWLDFVNGDARFPIITGYRTKETDNALDWRRIRHTNIQLQADDQVLLTAPTTTVDGNANVTGNLTAGAGASGSFTTMTGDVVIVQDGIVTVIF